MSVLTRLLRVTFVSAATSILVPVAAGATGGTTVPDSDPPSTTEVTATTAAAATTTAASTGLALELVADYPDRELRAFHSDGTLIYATSTDAESNTTFVAIDAAGAIVKEIPSTLYSVYDPLLINGTIFLVGSAPNVCGFFPFDTATLTPGAPIAVNDGSSCNSAVSFDPGSTTVAWVINDSANELVRADLATGEVVRTPFGAAIPEHYEPFGLAVLGGAAYVTLYPSFDPVTGDQYIAADGTELPELVLRFDPATATGTTVAGGGVDVVDGVVVVYTQEQAMQLDPATMSLSPYEGEFGGLPEGVAGDGVAWYTYTDGETSELIVSSRVPETAAIVNEARIAVPFPPDSYVDTGLFLLSGVPYVLASAQAYDEATQQTTVHSQLYRTTGG